MTENRRFTTVIGRLRSSGEALSDGESPYFDFEPDLIVECTRICDLNCRGCYAPNILQTAKISRGKDYSKLHLSARDVSKALDQLSELRGMLPITVALRGGEPSLNPELPLILKVLAQQVRSIYLETHGRWIEIPNQSLLDSCLESGVTLKISFDSMHATSIGGLKRICAIAENLDIDWLVAITEATRTDFESTRRLCDWVPDERIVVQPKVFVAEELVRPRLGVLKPGGLIEDELSTRGRILQ